MINPQELTEQGVIYKLYKDSLYSCKKRKLEPPLYTHYELIDWMYENGFKAIYDKWVESGYDTTLKPSLDRLDDYKTYSFDNIRLITWGENRAKGHQQRREGIGKHGALCKAVDCYKDGELIATYISAAKAAEELSLDHTNITKVCNGKRQSCGGYTFTYHNA